MIRIILTLQVCSVIAASAQPIDARNDLIFPVNPPRKVSPDENANIIPEAFSVRTFSSSATQILLPEQPELKITKAEVDETKNDTRELKVTISRLSSKKVRPSDIYIVGNFYELDRDGNVLLTTSRVPSNWNTPPVDWAESADEELTFQYSAPSATSGLKYAGCTLGVYLDNQLQDAWASTASILKQFPVSTTRNNRTILRIPSPSASKPDAGEPEKLLDAYKLLQSAKIAFLRGELDKAKDATKKAMETLVALRRDSPEWGTEAVESQIVVAKNLLSEIEKK